MNSAKNYCIILAGGKGKRLWPSSRETMPKQFLDFLGCGRTLLQQTYDRFAAIVPPEHILVNTNAAYADIVRAQLPNLDESNLMVEPIYRNTAPAAAWSTHRILHLCPEAGIVIAPADQLILDEECFARDITAALAFVESRDMIMTIGVKPSRPEPGYGYIQATEHIEDNIYHVQSFTEKPERDFARIFMQSGEFFWNTGIFLGNARYLFDCFEKMLPVVLRRMEHDEEDFSVERENAFIGENFPLYPNLSLDYGILERTDDVAVMVCRFGWADIGTWHGVYEAMSKCDGDNVALDTEVMLDEARNNIIKLPKGRLAVVSGLDGFIVAEQGNVLLICRKEDSSALVRKLSNELQLKKGDEYV